MNNEPFARHERIVGRIARRIRRRSFPKGLVGTGGAEGVRTPDLLNAIQALYQLSYDPNRENQSKSFGSIVKINSQGSFRPKKVGSEEQIARFQ